jgi:hypothetical protein
MVALIHGEVHRKVHRMRRCHKHRYTKNITPSGLNNFHVRLQREQNKKNTKHNNGIQKVIVGTLNGKGTNNKSNYHRNLV